MEGADDFEPDYEPSPVPSPHRDELPSGASEDTEMVEPDEKGEDLGEQSASEEETQLALRRSSSPEYDEPEVSEEERRPAKRARPTDLPEEDFRCWCAGYLHGTGEYNVIPLVIQTQPPEVRILPAPEATVAADPPQLGGTSPERTGRRWKLVDGEWKWFGKETSRERRLRRQRSQACNAWKSATRLQGKRSPSPVSSLREQRAKLQEKARSKSYWERLCAEKSS